jgi:hypothetical protein
MTEAVAITDKSIASRAAIPEVPLLVPVFEGPPAVTVVGLSKVVVTTEGALRVSFVANPTKKLVVPLLYFVKPNCLRKGCTSE